MPGSNLEAFIYERGHLLVLDQVKLPREHTYIEVRNTQDGWNVINRMNVRGAPAIGIAALLSLAVELAHTELGPTWTLEKLYKMVAKKLDVLVTARPTGVNLKIECAALTDFVAKEAANEQGDVNSLKEAIICKCEDLLRRDVKDNKNMGKHGAEHILESLKAPKANACLKILTHCNTGSLATGGYGTALGVVRSLHEMGHLKMAYCTETRPYNQGSRLTAYELVYEKMPALLVCDSAVGALMSNKGVSAVVVGADRIARNGDTANKIGTFQLAVLAKHHKIPFYIAAPTATIDLNTMTGKDIPIEDRSGEEITRCKCPSKVLLTPSEIQCWNPAFDVTPAELITGGIITEHGVIQPPVDKPENLKLLNFA